MAVMQEIKVYTTKWCPYCVAAKRLLAQRGYPFEEIDLEGDPDLRAQLSAANDGYRTVPMIYVGQEFIGGYTDMAELDRNGTLKEKVQRA